MAVRYSGNTPIFPLKDNADNVHSYKGIPEKYSNYSLFNVESAPLDVEPATKHVVGEGPSARFLGRVFAGKEDESHQPLSDPGEGHPQEGLPFKRFEYKGVEGDAPLRGNYGHEPGTSVYVNGARYHQNAYEFNGTPGEDIIKGEFGHKLRSEGGAATFGRFNPFNHHEKAVGDENPLLGDVGMTAPEGRDHPYGRNRTLEWNGLESDRAIF